MVTLKDVRYDLMEAKKLLQDGPIRWETAVRATAYISKAIVDLQDIEAGSDNGPKMDESAFTSDTPG